MTRRELMLRALLQATGQPRSHLEDVLDYVVATESGRENMDEEISSEEQAVLEAAFADEASGILAWYVRLMTGNEELIRSRARAFQRENAPKRAKRGGR
ncbi:hypothetical protein DesfrDRAFT_0177 [Solidesulfovibrio fructosivorans JJ]]|uniref:Uncharacterized protein n=1 Tax=Solidesulfovibrio fructosivorans JJ] TaxID=596151 RepID=E1JRC8_SOLFR|nr:hypothetical protein [Solidesulfovibrio fructosivorans]EFL53129.1 hypothetical protein DesfrDRAFT_0177 [Solidesulfovibrio fructosivorans JJ]]